MPGRAAWYPVAKSLGRSSGAREWLVTALTAGSLFARHAAVSAGSVGALGVATLLVWLLTVGMGAFMLGTWLAQGGLRRQRATGEGPPPAIIFGHAGLALTGLLVWVSYVLSGMVVLGLSAVGVLTMVIGFGVANVVLWTPYPGRAVMTAVSQRAGPAGGMLGAPAEDVLASRLGDDVLSRALTDDALAQALTDHAVASARAHRRAPAKKPRAHLTPLIPAAHGLSAVTTFFLATITAMTALR